MSGSVPVSQTHPTRDPRGRFAEGGAGGPGRRLAWPCPDAFARRVAAYLADAERPDWHGLGHHFGFVLGDSFRRYRDRPGYRAALAHAQVAIADARLARLLAGPGWQGPGVANLWTYLEDKRAEVARLEAMDGPAPGFVTP